MNMQTETEFFHNIAVKVRELVSGYKGKAAVAQYKQAVGDYSTEIDIAVEKLIVSEINKRFPNDSILAEEGHADTTTSTGRVWIIDPICGTSNVGRGLASYCTNIALAEKTELVAACVIDHSQNNYIWSVGNGEVYINNQLFQRQTAHKSFGTVIDIDFGALFRVSEAQQERHIGSMLKLIQNAGFRLISLNTSLGFAYTAVDKIDGFINAMNYPWDICAASFLIQQSGGIITDLEGKSWNLGSVGAIGANSAAIHKRLVDAYSES